MSRVRTELQAEADRIDADFFRVYERMQALLEKYPREGTWLRPSLEAMRKARSGLRQLMHNDDRQATS